MADLRAGKVGKVDAGQLLAVTAQVGADEGGLEEGGAGGGQDHLVRPDAVRGGVIAASDKDVCMLTSDIIVCSSTIAD